MRKQHTSSHPIRMDLSPIESFIQMSMEWWRCWMIGSATHWPSPHLWISMIFKKPLTLLGRLALLKAYAISKLSYHMFLEPLTPSECSMLNNMSIWFLWSNEETFNSGKTYHSKMSLDRMSLPKNAGGLGLWNWHNRSQAFLAKTAAWMDSNVSQQVKHQWEFSQNLSFVQLLIGPLKISCPCILPLHYWKFSLLVPIGPSGSGWSWALRDQ